MKTKLRDIRDYEMDMEYCGAKGNKRDMCRCESPRFWICSLGKNHQGPHHAHREDENLCLEVWEEVVLNPIYKNRVIKLREEMATLK
jgi:hypothetical protein